MGIEIVDPEKSYELPHASGAKFVMSHWTVAMQEEVDRRCLAMDGKGGYTYDVALDRQLKIDFAVKSWSGVTSNGEEVPCNPENKRKLPVGVQLWLVKDIEERAGLRMTDAEKKI